MRFRPIVAFLFVVSTLSAQQTIKITVVNNAVLIPVQLNDRQLSFLLDTGSEHSVVSTAAGSVLGLDNENKVQILKNYRKQAAGVANPASMSLGSLAFDHPSLAVVNLDSVSRALGETVDGVLGNDILQEFTFKLNYSKQLLVLGPLHRLGNLGRQVRLRRSGNDFFIPLQLMSVPVELLVDTGTNSTNLAWGTWQRLTHAWTPPAIVDGVVRAGLPIPPAFLVCLPSVELGADEIRDEAVRVQRPVESGAFAADSFGGILGSDLLRSFEITFDLKHDQLFLKKERQFQLDPYRYVTIGIQFARNKQGTYSVMSVWKNSPADQAGIRVGDAVSGIDGESTSEMTTEQVSSRLHGEVGTLVNLTTERNGVLSVVSLRTRQLLCGSHNPAGTLRASQN